MSVWQNPGLWPLSPKTPRAHLGAGPGENCEVRPQMEPQAMSWVSCPFPRTPDPSSDPHWGPGSQDLADRETGRTWLLIPLARAILIVTVSLLSAHCLPARRGKLRHRYTERRRPTRMEAQMPVMLLQAKGCHGLSASRSHASGMPFLPPRLQEKPPRRVLGFGHPSDRLTCGRTNSVVSSHPVGDRVL